MRRAFLVLLWHYEGCLKGNSITNFTQFSQTQLLKKVSYTFLTVSKLKKTILHKVSNVFKIFVPGLSHKPLESASRPKIVSFAESFIRVNLKDLFWFPLSTKEWLSFFKGILFIYSNFLLVLLHDLIKPKFVY